MNIRKCFFMLKSLSDYKDVCLSFKSKFVTVVWFKKMLGNMQKFFKEEFFFQIAYNKHRYTYIFIAIDHCNQKYIIYLCIVLTFSLYETFKISL